MTTLKKPATRRIGNLIVRISEDGLEIRGFHKHAWKKMSWPRIASLADETELLAAMDAKVGEKVLEKMGAQCRSESVA